MSKKKQKQVVKVNKKQIRNEEVTRAMEVTDTLPEVTEEPVIEPEYPVIPDTEIDVVTRDFRNNNIKLFMSNGIDMDSIHLFSKKCEVITSLFTENYKFELMKHRELIERLNIELFDIFEVLEISFPDHRLTANKYMSANGELMQESIPNTIVLFSSTNDSNRDNNIIITLIGVSPKTISEEDETYFNNKLNTITSLFISLFPTATIYQENVNYDLIEDNIYKTVDFLFTSSMILRRLSMTQEQLLELSNGVIDNVTKSYEDRYGVGTYNNFFLNLFHLIEDKDDLSFKFLYRDKLMTYISIPRTVSDNEGNVYTTSTKFTYPVNLEIDFDEDDEEEIEEQIVHGGRPMSPEAMNDGPVFSPNEF